SWFFFFSSRRRHTIWPRDWSSDVCSSDLSTHFVSSTPIFLPDLVTHNMSGGSGPSTALPMASPTNSGAAARKPRQASLSSSLNKIGRASCRERVDVSVLGGVVKYKNKKRK